MAAIDQVFAVQGNEQHHPVLFALSLDGTLYAHFGSFDPYSQPEHPSKFWRRLPELPDEDVYGPEAPQVTFDHDTPEATRQDDDTPEASRQDDDIAAALRRAYLEVLGLPTHPDLVIRLTSRD